MIIFNADYLDGLTAKAQANPRKGQHLNIHKSGNPPTFNGDGFNRSVQHLEFD